MQGGVFALMVMDEGAYEGKDNHRTNVLGVNVGVVWERRLRN